MHKNPPYPGGLLCARVRGAPPLAICFETWKCAVLGYAMPFGFAERAKLRLLNFRR